MIRWKNYENSTFFPIWPLAWPSKISVAFFSGMIDSRPHLYPMGGKIKKSNVLHYICLFPCSKNDFKCVWPFSCPKTAFKGRTIKGLIASSGRRPREAVNVNFPAFKGRFQAGKRPNTLEIVFATRKKTNVMEYITFFDFAAHRV